jgi:hypothetical protein
MSYPFIILNVRVNMAQESARKPLSLAVTDLPFKIKRAGTPKIIHKKSWRPRYRGEQRPDAEYAPKLDAIVFYGSKPPPRSLQEHELAHYQLGFGRDKQLLTTEDMAEQEIQADLLVYAKTKKPPYYDIPLPDYMNENAKGLSSDTKHYVFGLYTLWRDLYDRLDAFKGSRANKMEAVRQSIESAIKKYWRYLPPDWKKAYEISDQLMRQTVQRAEKSQPTVRLVPTKSRASSTQPRMQIKKAEVHRGVAYTDKSQKRLSRRHHRGWKRVRFS